MKNKIMLLIIILLVALVAVPTPAFAYSGVTGQVRNASTGQGWTFGGAVYIINTTQNNFAGQGSLNSDGTFTVPYNLVSPDVGNSLYVYIVLNPGSEGTPDPLSSSQFSNNSSTNSYDVGVLNVGSGPNSIELVDFSVTPQSGSNFWLPYILLICSIILVGGLVTWMRKRSI
jgi:hypothetical protein